MRADVIVLFQPGFDDGLSLLPRGPCATAHGPLLKRRETRLTDGFPVTRLVLFEQAVPDQYVDPAFTNFDRRDHGHTPRAALSESPCPNRG